MSYRLRVTVEVVLQEGQEEAEPVDWRGHIHTTAKKEWSPLISQIELREYAHVENAHTALNKTHALLTDLREIMQ